MIQIFLDVFMIVHMMALGSKTEFNILFKCTNKLFSLLVLIFVLMLSCDSEKEVNSKGTVKNERKTNDTLFVEIACNDAPKTGLNVVNEFFHYDYVEIECDSNGKANYKLDKKFDNQILKYVGYSVIDGEFTRHKHYYLIDEYAKDMEFDYIQGDLKIVNDSITEVLVLDNLFKAFDHVNSLNASNEKKLELIDSLRSENILKSNDKSDVILNRIKNDIYFDALQRIDPGNIEIDNYLKTYEGPILAGDAINNLIYFYVKNRINDFSFNDFVVNESSYSKLLSIGIFNFLRHEDNKGDNQYLDALNWLKTTDLYKSNSVFVNKEISPIDNKLFKTHLERLDFINLNGETKNIKQVLNSSPSEYYLFDFWATWCAPCIQGVKIMKRMDIPNNLKVISVSLDEKADKEKWIKLTRQLGQEITFWFDNTNKDVEGFVGLLEMQSIPRYILIDKNLNLIDQAFYHPNEDQFLNKLKDLRNHKYW